MTGFGHKPARAAFVKCHVVSDGLKTHGLTVGRIGNPDPDVMKVSNPVGDDTRDDAKTTEEAQAEQIVAKLHDALISECRKGPDRGSTWPSPS